MTYKNLQTGTPEEFAEYLTTGYWDEVGSASPIFKSTSRGPIVVTYYAEGMPAENVAAFEKAMTMWKETANVRFERVGANPHLILSDERAGAYTTTYVDGQPAMVNVNSGWFTRFGTDFGDWGWTTLIHELGHALGLGHPGPYNGSATLDDLAFQNDSYAMTIMSYISQSENPLIDGETAYPATPMLADVLAVQDLFGVSTISAGNTRYGLTGSASTTTGEILLEFARTTLADRLDMDPFTMTLFDASGVDTLDFRGFIEDAVIDLRSGQFSDIGGIENVLAIATNATIENALSGRGSDKITGNAAWNKIKAGGGHDKVAGLGGDDRLFGGAGRDRLNGHAGDDWLTGGAGRDILIGGGGSDTFVFHKGCGRDVVRDFDFLEEDAALFHAGFWEDMDADTFTLADHVTATERAIIVSGDYGDKVVFRGLDDTELSDLEAFLIG